MQQVFDLPGRAESKVAFHMLGRRGHPSFEEGIGPFSNGRLFIHTCYERPYRATQATFAEYMSALSLRNLAA
jgi:hypothetical protein